MENIKKATLKELGLEKVPVHEIFTPKYFFIDGDRVQWLVDALPHEHRGDYYVNGLHEWYEIGIDDDENLKYTPELVRDY